MLNARPYILQMLIVWGIMGTLGAGCQKKVDISKLPAHSLIYGGDITLARNLNRALFDSQARDNMFKGIKPLLEEADIALGNAEGVISTGGRYTHKGEPRPHMYRAHPNVIDALVDADIDVLTVGNNHAGDYGQFAFREMLDRLTIAGIGYTGGGENLKDAKTPYYQRVGDTVVAIVGCDMTISDPVKALPKRPGPLFLGFFMHSKLEASTELLKGLEEILEEARKHAHIVLFTPHWGDNWRPAPNDVIRTLAKKIITMGYDGIIGHSAHIFQGVELIDGKPVVYDAGNMLLDYAGGRGAGDGMLWKLVFNRAGVTRIVGHPIKMTTNRTTVATGKTRDGILEKVKALSKDLGTELTVEDGVLTASCDPGPLKGPSEATDPPRRTRKGIRMAPSDTVLDALPKTAIPVNVQFDEGIRLVGYEMLVEEHSFPKSGQFVILYWTTDRQIMNNYTIHLEARGEKSKPGFPRVSYSSHLGGDWIFPTTEWPKNKIIKDWSLFRLTMNPEGEVSFYAGLFLNKLLTPIDSDQPLEDEKLVPLGTTRYVKGTPNIFETLRTYEIEHKELGVYH